MGNYYTMGNAGDIIKHGLLAEFVEWWKDSKHETLRVADTFGGSPCADLSINNETLIKTLKDLECHALGRAYSGIYDKYLGSGHLIHRVAEKSKLKVNIDIFDKNKAVRCKLEKFRHKDSMELIELPKDNGYTILCDKQKPEQYGLIFIDPYKKFLRDEFYWNEGNPKKTGYFTRIIELTKKHSNLFVAVFVVDMNKENKVGEGFANFKRDKLSRCTFSLRYPKQKCDKYNFEILLISEQIADEKCDKLRERLDHFATKASYALSLPCGETIKFWDGGQS